MKYITFEARSLVPNICYYANVNEKTNKVENIIFVDDVTGEIIPHPSENFIVNGDIISNGSSTYTIKEIPENDFLRILEVI